MFCPTCGRDNSIERKYCASCGTNLEAVSQALSGSEDDFFTKLDTTLDHFLARYAEHVFKDAPLNAAEQRVGKSWQVLGQSVATSLIDLLLFLLMWNIIPLRFLLLLISTPIRLISQQGKNKKAALPGSLPGGSLPGGTSAPALPDPVPKQWRSDSVGSVTEHTTVLLPDSKPPKKKD
jgi:hypothetical protein